MRSRISLSVLFVVAFVFIAGEPVAAMVISAASYEGHIYYLLDTNGTKWWAASETEAVSLSGHLVSINDDVENQWVLDTFGPISVAYATEKNLPNRTRISLWTGLNDAQSEGTYQWASGEASSYVNWNNGQPQNAVADEDYVGVFVNFGGAGKWHDIVGNNRFGDLPFGVVESTRLIGDYDSNDVVDAADYVVWRNAFGLTVNPTTGADGNGNGTIDNADFDLWKATFGTIRTVAGSQIAAAVPEPQSFAFSLVLTFLRRCRRRQVV